MPLNLSILEGPYLRDLLDQPRVLAETAAGLTEAPELRRLAGENFRRIVLTGMGGSFHVLLPLHLDLVAHGLPSIMAESSELLDSMPRLLEDGTLLIVLSQSGLSAEIVRLVETRGGRGRTIAVTNSPESPLARAADAVVLTHAGPESTVSCKTSVTSLLALGWLSAILRGGDLRKVRGDLEQAAPAAARYLAGWRGHVEALACELEGARDLFLLARGASMAAAGLGGLIVKEAAHVHSEGMTAAAFRHGPFELLSPEVFVLVYQDAAARAEALVRDVRAAGARAGLAGPATETAALRIEPVPAAVRPILELLPAQMISLALAGLRGREPGRFQLITKVTTVE